MEVVNIGREEKNLNDYMRRLYEEHKSGGGYATKTQQMTFNELIERFLLIATANDGSYA